MNEPQPERAVPVERMRVDLVELYRSAIRFVADWEALARLAEKVAYDSRLRSTERENLYDAIDVCERRIRPMLPSFVAG